MVIKKIIKYINKNHKNNKNNKKINEFLKIRNKAQHLLKKMFFQLLFNR